MWLHEGTCEAGLRHEPRTIAVRVRACAGSQTLGEGSTGVVGGLVKMWRAGGVRALWQGNGANVIQVGRRKDPFARRALVVSW